MSRHRLGLLACAAVWAASGAPSWPAMADERPPAGLAARSDVRVSIFRRGPADQDGVVREVELRGEAASESAAREYGFRSMRQRVDIDCAARRDRVIEMEAFEAHGLQGRGLVRRPPGQWAAPSPDAYLADVITAVCHGAGSRAPVRLALSASPPPMPTKMADFPGIAAAPVQLAAQARPSSRPVRTAPSLRPPAPPPVMRTAVAGPAPARVRAPVAAAPIAALAIISGPQPLSRPPARGWLAQVGAASTPDGARQDLNRAAPLMGRGLAGRVEAATVQGRRVYRATVSGFGSQIEASGFCEKVERSGGGCWTR